MLSYIFYWLAVVAVLIRMKYTEVSFCWSITTEVLTLEIFQGRTELFGRGSAAHHRLVARQSSGGEKEYMDDSKNKIEGAGKVPEGIHTLPH